MLAILNVMRQSQNARAFLLTPDKRYLTSLIYFEWNFFFFAVVDRFRFEISLLHRNSDHLTVFIRL